MVNRSLLSTSWWWRPLHFGRRRLTSGPPAARTSSAGRYRQFLPNDRYGAHQLAAFRRAERQLWAAIAVQRRTPISTKLVLAAPIFRSSLPAVAHDDCVPVVQADEPRCHTFPADDAPALM